MTGAVPAGGGFGTDDPPRASYTLRVNGVDRPVADAWIGESLLYVLRERLGLAGAKGGCDQGECGACSVQLDGQLTAACLVPAALAADSEIRTVEGLADDGTASDVQRALAESGAVQCGYCVPGLAMAVHDLLERNHDPAELETREALCGNLCRCTGYRGALAAVRAVAQSRAEQAEADAEAGESSALIPEQQTQTPPQAVAQPQPVPPQSVQQQSVPQQAAPQQSVPQQATPQQVPQPALAQSGPAQQPSAYPQPGYAEQPYAEQPYAEQTYPDQPYPAEQPYAGQPYPAEQPYAEPPVPQPQYVGLPQQSGPPDQQPQHQPQYEYQPTTGLYPDPDGGGYNPETSGYHQLPHQQTTAAPEAGA
ncbi:hypothetical protein GXP74_06325 [Streptacidiphilus sp. P02-A3a]|nr:hypothetical protein GXP74_06325 [Streptacidiphilus sp. P02-A3a]